ncbi:MAG: type II secretion system F family protein [Candidatus Dojkabacteria bacterium]|nr:MAG: type II secretion system F family protein [Candidatus Dojkabacteria bacterium]
MNQYKYSARNKEGAVIKGKLKASSENDVADSLQAKGLIVVDIKEDVGVNLERLNEINIGGVPMADKVVFMRQLSTMISAGLPLSQALEILEAQAGNPKFKKVLADVTADVKGGTALAVAFRKSADVFDDITVSLIEAGEESGHLEEILKRLATELENQKKLKDKVKSAFTYPAVIVVVIIAVIAIMLLVLVPAMEDIYSEFDAELPWVTQALVAMSNFVINFWWLIIVAVATIGILSKYYFDTPKGRKFKDKAMLRLPVFGNLIKKIQITQFTRVLSLLLKSGLSIVEALQLTSNSLSNTLFKEAVLEAKKEVEKGTPMATPIARSQVFPLIVSQMIAVGEESGQIDMVLEKMAEYYNSEVEVITNNLTTLLEPLILIVMGGVIAFIALGVYMPMFSLVEVIG